MNNISKNFSGMDIEKMKQAAESGNINSYIDNNLSKDSAEKIKEVLGSKEATEKLLSSPQAKELMKKLGLK